MTTQEEIKAVVQRLTDLADNYFTPGRFIGDGAELQVSFRKAADLIERLAAQRTIMLEQALSIATTLSKRWPNNPDWSLDRDPIGVVFQISNMVAGLEAAPGRDAKEIASMDDAQIKHMVERFLAWKLPRHFRPDGGISFEPVRNNGTLHEFRFEPVGTNLFDAGQAETMVRHMLEGLPLSASSSVSAHIKPLVWYAGEFGGEAATTPLGFYLAFQGNDGQWWLTHSASPLTECCSSLEEAKSKSQAHWVERISPMLTEGPAIPDGWKLVPIEPDDAMLKAGRVHAVPSTQAIAPIYTAMLNASPSPRGTSDAD